MKFSFCDLYISFCLNYLNKLRLFSFAKREKRSQRDYVLRYALEQIKEDGVICEFGVHNGTSINILAETLPDKVIFGFDSFKGFPDDGRKDWQQDFSTEIPKVKSNTKLVIGYFEDTLPQFWPAHEKKISFMHIDCDIYSSTKNIFDSIIKYKIDCKNCIVVFDELINYKTAIWNEMLALYRFLFSTNMDIKWICCHHAVENIDEALYKIENNIYPENSIIRGDGKYWRQQAALKIVNSKIEYSDLLNSEYCAKVKYMTRLLKKINEKLNMNSLCEDDFIEKYELDNGYIKQENDTILELEPSTCPYMKKAVSMQFPEKYFAAFLKKRGISPETIIEIGGGKRFNFSNIFNCKYINFDFSKNTGIETVIKNIVTDDFVQYKEFADIVYSNNTFEHIVNPFVAAQNIIGMLKHNGIVFIRAPFSYRYHPVPNDYWRFTPAGLRQLFPNFECLECGLDIHARRRNDIGSFANKLDEVPIDDLGGWRETWFAYFIGRKI